MLQLANLNLYRDTKKITSDLSVDIDQGSTLMIYGDNASGKSTVIECLVGKLKPFHGQVLIDGHDLHNLAKKDKQLFFNSTGIVFQESSLRPFDTVSKALHHNHVSAGDVREMMLFLGMEKDKNTVLHKLSFSQRRSLDLASSIIHSPSLLIWDEPYLSLDEKNIEKFNNKLLDLKNSGTTVIISTLSRNEFDFLNPEKVIQL